jgi:hypothetical protein
MLSGSNKTMALQPKLAHRIEVRDLEAKRFPLGKGEIGGSDLHAVIIVRCAVGL